ncbi:hypothetical protein [Xenorhabdus bovienii]|uniref:hypothetical protein n=1 Tax=Xenorhabdus bovienii TaxID=40576 RepID=UPI0023B21189|nr:hypothetical protein [Xenorhabdus bovienii]MDE9533317.1 VCBS repeat-containing protein [Xenorhabdus bovienii]MDE9586261.1 VCBS repeat-containing protein [Xenorhabdus bovienii]
MTNDYSKLPIPIFEQVLVADQLRDEYWLEAPDINKDGLFDLFGYGLSLGEIYWYRNPDWKRHLVVDNIRMPVGGDYADVSGNGYPDIIVCYDLYGPGGTLYDANPTGGKIDWIENPGSEFVESERWKRHYVGRTTGMHRLRAGFFTQTDHLEILGLPIVPHGNIHSLLPVVLFTKPDNVKTANEWPMDIIENTFFRLIHGAEKKRGLIPGSDRDSLLLASDEGITWLYYDDQKSQWIKVLIGVGELTQFESTGFRGSGDLDVGRAGGDPFAYVAAVEPFHGNTVAVYVKDKLGTSAELATWKRFILDVFGDPNENGEGPGHQVLCADFDGDGEDEFLVALRGPWPWQGVFYYKAIDLSRGIFTRWRVSSESVARIAAADFNQDGKLDFATIAYSVPNYFVAKQARIVVHLNQIK